MSGRIARVGAQDRGFTMVELLVTIIIAAIFFGAMIPFLVNAQSQTAHENMRNIALQLARDKIESIHQLDYNSVTEAYLDDNGPPADDTGQFGTQWTAYSGNSQKTFYIGYDVTTVAASGTSAAYKIVSVSVSWDGAPKPNFTDYSGATPAPAANDPIVLQTQVAPQYFGPQIVNLTSPAAVDATDPNNPVYVITAGASVPLVATIATPDLPQMTGTPSGQVVFTVTDMNGNAVASGTASAPTASGGNQYQWDWDASSASTGYYTFSAYAESGTNASGNTWSVTYSVQAAGLPAPQGLAATPGDASVNLSWSAVSGAASYQVWRSTSSGQEVKVAEGVQPTTYLDTSVANGTTYYYKVLAVDGWGTTGDPSAEVICTPAVTADTTPPSVPTNLVQTDATATGIAFSWSASTDPSPHASGLVEYQVWRSPSGAAGTYVQIGTVVGTQSNPPVTQYTDFGLDPGTTYYYEVCAVDGDNNVSGYSSPGAFATTATTPTGTLTVQNKSQGNTKISVDVYSLTTEEWYATGGNVWSTPFWVLIENSGAAKITFTQLPAGTAFGAYQVTATDGQTTQQQSVTVLQGKTTTISFRF